MATSFTLHFIFKHVTFNYGQLAHQGCNYSIGHVIEQSLEGTFTCFCLVCKAINALVWLNAKLKGMNWWIELKDIVGKQTLQSMCPWWPSITHAHLFCIIPFMHPLPKLVNLQRPININLHIFGTWVDIGAPGRNSKGKCANLMQTARKVGIEPEFLPL